MPMAWVVKEAERRLDHAVRDRSRAERRSVALAARGIAVDMRIRGRFLLVALYLGIVCIAALGLRELTPKVFASYAPASAPDALLTLLQVQVTAFAVAFPLLLLFIQFAREPVVVAHSVAQILLRRSWMDLTGLFLLLGTVALGVIALWLQSDASVVLSFFFIFVPGLIVLGLSFLRVLQLVLDPIRLRSESADVIKRQLRASMTRAWIYSSAAEAIGEAAARRGIDLQAGRREPSQFDGGTWTPLVQGFNAFVADVEAERLATLVDSLRSPAVSADPEPAAATEQPRIELILGAWPGERARSDRPLILLRTENPDFVVEPAVEAALLESFRMV